MLCLGFLIFLLAAVTFSNIQNYTLSSVLMISLQGNSLTETFVVLICLNQGRKVIKENHLSPPTLPYPLHAHKILLKLPSTYNNAHYVIHRNVCVLVYKPKSPKPSNIWMRAVTIGSLTLLL